MAKLLHTRHTLEHPAADRVTIRRSYPDDASAIARLAALDSRRAPAGDLLVAEVDGELWAAVTMNGAAAVADPFRATAGLVRLLRIRAAQLEATARDPRAARRRRGQLVSTRRQPAA
jgi:hypothetical protein